MNLIRIKQQKIRYKRYGVIVLFLGAFAKLREAPISFMSVRPHGTTRLPLDGFSLNLVFQDFSKICGENSSYSNIVQE